MGWCEMGRGLKVFLGPIHTMTLSTKNYLQKLFTKKKKINKNFLTTIPPPLASLSLCLSEIEIKQFRKCTTHEYISQFRPNLNKTALQ